MGNVPRKARADTPADNSNAAKVVHNAISKYPVVIYSKTYCPYCRSAKSNINAALSKIEDPPQVKIYELDKMGVLGIQVQDYLAQLTGRRTVPNVFIGGKSIGGGDETAGYASRGVLVQMLTQAPQQLADQFPPQTAVPTAVTSPPSAEQIAQDAIDNNPVVVFSKSYCPFCVRAKGLLAERMPAIDGLPEPKIFEMDRMGSEGAAIQQYLLQKTGQRTVPNIFIAQEHIGGCDDVYGLDARGELVAKLTAAVPNTTAEDEQPVASETKEIVFGAGCFWGVELAFQRVAGVISTEVGYSNGKMERITYDAICTGATGAAEVVRVLYDPSVVYVGDLLRVWESRHDPTSLNKQGNDTGTQYRSAIYYNDEDQAEEIRQWIAEAATRHSKEIVTDIAPVKNYCAAEEYHQRYLEKKGQDAQKGSTAYIRCYG
ncbi:hypothetical protein BWQ96_04550 [Gracilariopsis chorda]|uniref:peptide-methionine (S)-S-oxide reductase n=1 Tax=Gracilariopsis chorda TaxID=448386 RepID=A0A2V3IU33_9FLOR|nr:hypothetical protein BWQ96_04550 [Gracilariopsis chorda]|eukprot:PXF45646.1 hypothetical protein BWQ96_04550 [Gracilariopsis chorda]